LPGNAIAWSVGDGTILIDMSAAGHGWFVDSTPMRDEEFRNSFGDVLIAKAGSDAFGRMDLLTVLEHEIGHALGYTHLAPDGNVDLMDATLAPGTRIGMPELSAGVPVESAQSLATPAERPFELDIGPAAPAPLAAVIDWKRNPFVEDQKVQAKKVSLGVAPPVWIADFVNYAGQSEAQRNPNAGLKIHLSATNKVVPQVSSL
jgi:hypothetical protein